MSFSDRIKKWRHMPTSPTHAAVPDSPLDPNYPVDGDILSYEDDVRKYIPSQTATITTLNVTDIVATQLDVDYIDFSAVGAAIAAGRLTWNAVTGTLESGLLGGVSAVQLGQEIVALVSNDTGGDIDDGIAVYISGADGTNLEITTADVGAAATALAIGLLTEDIVDGATGFVTTHGIVTGLDTSAFVNGDLLYLDAAGALTDTRPVAGEAATGRIVEMGIVVFADAAGVIYLNPRVLPALLDLSDVLDAVPANGDVLMWHAIGERFQLIPGQTDKSWGFQSEPAGTGVRYAGGFYEFGATNDDFTGAVTHGTANAAKWAKYFLVLGALAVDEITLTITGTSMLEDGTRAPADTEDIVIPDASVADTYFESLKNWVGQVSVIVTAGTPKDCNWGFAKYWDNNESNFTLNDFDITWFGGATDNTADIQLKHHQQTGWTYNAGAVPTPPTSLAIMATDLNVDKEIIAAEHGGYRRDDLDVGISGSAQEGIIWEITNSVAAAFLYGNIITRITQRR